MTVTPLATIGYLAASLCFVFGIRQLSSPATARNGNRVAALGMLIALVVTELLLGSTNYAFILPTMLVAAVVGAYASRAVRMTAMPQMVAMFNGMGAGAAMFVGVGDYRDLTAVGNLAPTESVTILLSCLIGSLSFTGSAIAFAKLQELMTGRPITYPAQKPLNGVLLLGIVAIGIVLVAMGHGIGLLVVFVLLSMLLGVLFVLPVGGADMPVIISLLNSFTGTAAAMTGFVLGNNVLIVAGALVGASGAILTQLMGKAMNRSLANVLFSAFGQGDAAAAAAGAEGGTVRSASVEDVAALLAFAQQVVIAPGYGLAVARGQHDVKELADQLEKRGVTVKYAIHPVAGRMPGHMNVLLAEANVPYPALREMDDINPEFPRTDVVLVIGANDVVNPAARTQPGSPIFGMPILNVDSAKTVVVLKRSMATGFAGIDNPLFYEPNTLMLFGDARDSLQKLVAEIKHEYAT
ncbi:MAG TPA: NAD(P)(+) transhydrogenase (Re/Si-specific) subunit beta [Candidatus Dormibacteraeota bacterium]|jgi:NAD(P) transhydrogenase subunit beta|nr:NAD(P)(+) transhydrogenase (Re/Si-specific) subunit beta [Candidatus Dormibacteraeota bacterium]